MLRAIPSLLILLPFLASAQPAAKQTPAAGPSATGVYDIVIENGILFPGRDMALVGPKGHQELIFLDHGHISAQPSDN